MSYRHLLVICDGRSEADDAARADLDRAARVLGSPAAFAVLYGEPSRAAAEGARELGCDAIMLPAPSRRRLGRLPARDRASALRRRANCPVLQPR